MEENKELNIEELDQVTGGGIIGGKITTPSFINPTNPQPEIIEDTNDEAIITIRSIR